MRGSHLFTAAVACLAIAASAGLASAQDYEQSQVSNQLEMLPANPSQINGIADDSITAVALPFEFPYYGGVATTIYVHDNGYVQLRPTTVPAGFSPFFNSAFPPASSGNTDGMVAPYWEDIDPTLGSGTVGTFTVGTAPNRKFVVYWDQVQLWGSTGTSYSFQLHLYETTGRIGFAYGQNTSSWTSMSYSTGFAAPGTSDSRFTSPNTSGNITTHPGTDYHFDPTITDYTGTILFDAVVSDDSGIGNSVIEDIPAAGLRVELRTEIGVGAFATVGSTGAFAMKGYALDSSLEGTLYLVAENAACRVSPSTSQAAGATHSVELANEIALDEDEAFGTLSIDNTTDANFSARGPLQIAHTIGAAREWIAARTSDEVAQLEVYFSSGDSSASRFSKAASESPAYLLIAGAGSGNRDEFDSSVILRGYARHVLEQITGMASSTTSMVLDSVTDEGNALADGFGLYLDASLGDLTVTYDGVDASTTTEIDLETPSFNSARAGTVGGWAGGALFDLIDGANEAHDPLDGSSDAAQARPFEVIDAMTAPFDLDDLITEWNARDHNSAGLVSILIHHGLLADDTNEPNDTTETATVAGTAGVRVNGQSLNRFNEDWYKVQVDETNARFFVDLTYNRFSTNADVLLELRSPAGPLLATGAYDGANGPIRAQLESFGPGALMIRVVHQGGDFVSDYVLQAFAQLKLASAGAPEWTAGRPINQPLLVEGGIPPYTLGVKPPSTLPRGMLFDLANGVLRGSPQDPGETTFTIQVSDSGTPATIATVTQTFRVNDVLSFTAPGLVGVALDRPADVNLGRTGGTNPITLTEVVTNFPPGLSLTEDFHVAGTATAIGGGPVSFTATDLAGSTADVASTVVVCAPVEGKSAEITIGAGFGAAAGIYFDALVGSTVKVSFKTAKKNPKRELQVIVIGPDGLALEGGTRKIKPGKVAISGLFIPASGRYFVTLAGEDAGDESVLLAKRKVAVPKKGAGFEEQLAVDDRVYVEFGALAGATFLLKGKSPQGMKMRVQFLIKPDGSAVPASQIELVEGKKGFTISTTVDQDGTYGLFLLPAPGDLGDLSYKFKVKQPKKLAFIID